MDGPRARAYRSICNNPSHPSRPAARCRLPRGMGASTPNSAIRGGIPRTLETLGAYDNAARFGYLCKLLAGSVTTFGVRGVAKCLRIAAIERDASMKKAA